MSEMLICPYCNKKFNSLYRHITLTHNIDFSKFKEDYPNSPLQIYIRKNEFHSVCECCGKEFDRKNLYILHLKYCDYKKYLELKKARTYGYECQICHNLFIDLKQHLNIKHNLEFKDYCETYNWDIEKSKFITNEYRKKLSENKKHFYNETKRGKELKRTQSDNMSGNKNMACRNEIRSKISLSAIKRIKENPFFINSYGIRVKYDKYSVRSFEEFKVLYLLLKNKVEFGYENFSIKYLLDDKTKNYLVDFTINGNYYEIKSTFKNIDFEKYNTIKEEFKKKNLNFEIVTYDILKEKLNLIEDYNIFDECKKLLNEDKIKFDCVTYYDKSKILSKICDNYKNNKNIKFTQISKKDKNMIKWVEIENCEVEEHNDYVYDIELEKNHYFSANNIITHNCRLRNSIENQINEFSFTLGAGGEMTGSKNVMTINLNRLIQDKRDLRTEVDKVHKYQVSVNDYFTDLYNKDMLPVFKAGYNSLDKQFLTIGINGIVEGAEYLGYTISNNPEYMKFISDTLKEISDINKENSKKYNVKFNTEFIPGENVAVVFAKKDKADGYKVTRDCYSSYIYAPEDENISILDKFEMMGGKSTEYLDGGSAYHCNLDDYPSKEQFIKLLEISSKTKCKYFCFNIKITICNDCGNIDKKTLTECPKCGSKNIDYGTRIIGYLKRISNFSTPRQKEHALRYYSKEK